MIWVGGKFRCCVGETCRDRHAGMLGPDKIWNIGYNTNRVTRQGLNIRYRRRDKSAIFNANLPEHIHRDT